MNSRKARELIDRLGQLQNIRAQWDAIWDFIALRTSPKNACFQSEHQTGQPRSAWHKYDSTASLAINKWASAMDGITTPKTQKWHGLTLTDEKLSEKYRTYLEEIRDTLFARRYAANSNFANANYENLRSVGTFGNGAFSLTESRDFKGNVYKAWNLREFFIDQNYGGEVDTFYRKFRLTARQAKQEFGENCPERIKEAKNLQEEFEFLWAVYPNSDYEKGSLQWGILGGKITAQQPIDKTITAIGQGRDSAYHRLGVYANQQREGEANSQIRRIGTASYDTNVLNFVTVNVIVLSAFTLGLIISSEPS